MLPSADGHPGQIRYHLPISAGGHAAGPFPPGLRDPANAAYLRGNVSVFNRFKLVKSRVHKGLSSDASDKKSPKNIAT